MKKTSKAVRNTSDDLRPEYAFGYSKAKANPYAARLKGWTVAAVLEPDVAAAFPNSEAVNTQLRAVVDCGTEALSEARGSPKARWSDKGMKADER